MRRCKRRRRRQRRRTQRQRVELGQRLEAGGRHVGDPVGEEAEVLELGQRPQAVPDLGDPVEAEVQARQFGLCFERRCACVFFALCVCVSSSVVSSASIRAIG